MWRSRCFSIHHELNIGCRCGRVQRNVRPQHPFEECLQSGSFDIPNEVRSINHRESSVPIAVEHAPDAEIAGLLTNVQRDQLRLHDVAAALVERDRDLLLQERVALEKDVQVVDAFVYSISNDFRDENSQHEGDDVGHPAGELQHDGHQGDGHTTNSSQHGCCTHHRVNARLDVPFAEEVGVCVPMLHQDPDASAEASAHEERWHEEASRAECAEGDRHLKEPYKASEQEREDKPSRHRGEFWVALVVS
mmetsp:Transcript_34302/g.74086  ORF Transcript_34302/g.74086 Transcript_34302/m.74086 type:complete len:249 (-) Transcript_34302:1484-2230(-)